MIYIFICILLVIILIMSCCPIEDSMEVYVEGSVENPNESFDIQNVFYNDNAVFMKSFVPYMIQVAHVPNDIIDNWIKLIPTSSDGQLMDYIREVSPTFEMTTDNYSNKSNKTARRLARILRDGWVSRINSYLDIGAITDTQIKAMSDILKIPYDNCYGINVSDDSTGAITYGQEKGEKIIIYDGVNIPVINSIEQFDLVTILSTLHHIPSPELEMLIENLGQHASKYILIKENNLDNKFAKIYMDWQHRLFGRRSILHSYTRFDLTYNKLKKMFANIGFRVKHRVSMKHFTKSDFILFEKKI